MLGTKIAAFGATATPANRTETPHTMRRTATMVGIAAALALPSIATAGSSPQVVAQAKPQLKAHVVTTHLKHVSTARVRARVRIPELGDQQIPKAPTTSALCQGTVVAVGQDDRYGLELFTWSTCGRRGGLKFG